MDREFRFATGGVPNSAERCTPVGTSCSGGVLSQTPIRRDMASECPPVGGDVVSSDYLHEHVRGLSTWIGMIQPIEGIPNDTYHAMARTRVFPRFCLGMPGAAVSIE